MKGALRKVARDPLLALRFGLKAIGDRVALLAYPADVVMAFTEHRRRVGRWPRAWRPRTFNEKLVRKRIKDRRRYLTETADKVSVRSFVAERVGAEHLARFHAVVERAEDLDFDALPDSFVIKPSHGSGRVAVVEDRSDFDLEELRAAGARWLEERWPLWNRRIPPRLVVEELLRSPTGGPAEDYKFFVCNGRIEVIQFVDRFGDGGEGLYDAGWNLLPAAFKPPPGPAVPPPANLELMSDLALRLAEGTDFVRVDLYDLGDRVVFGELTHTPHAGAGRFTPDSFDWTLGERWDQPRSYRDAGLIQHL